MICLTGISLADIIPPEGGAFHGTARTAILSCRRPRGQHNRGGKPSASYAADAVAPAQGLGGRAGSETVRAQKPQAGADERGHAPAQTRGGDCLHGGQDGGRVLVHGGLRLRRRLYRRRGDAGHTARGRAHTRAAPRVPGDTLPSAQRQRGGCDRAAGQGASGFRHPHPARRHNQV